jgi:hypothetical protein
VSSPEAPPDLHPPNLHPVEAALLLLSRMGVSGKHVWMTAKAIEDPGARFAYLRQAIRHFRRFKGAEDKYVMLPVDPRTRTRPPRRAPMPPGPASR